MDNRIEKLKSMQTNLLIDVVKRYQQFGYPIEIKNEAIKILEQRGIKMDQLELTGKIKNTAYDAAVETYQQYKLFSIIALVLNIISIFLMKDSSYAGYIFYIIMLIFILLSFSSARKLSVILNDESIDYSYIYIFVGMFLYFIIFFITRNHIKEAIKRVQ